MENYDVMEPLGSGTFGVVYSALHKPSGETVAVKILKGGFSGSWKECLSLPEVRCSSQLLKHPNIVQLKDVAIEHNSVFMVFELMEGSLFEVMQARQRAYTETEVRNMCVQILKGLDYMHKNGYFHRDLKPENLLVKQGLIKIGDLGSAIEINSHQPLESYIGTVWYRAPEMLLGSRFYGPKVDMWTAMGAIMAEMFDICPLFPGKDEHRQLYQICRVIGSPTMKTWPEGIKFARLNNYVLPRTEGVCLSTLLPAASDSARNLISSLCSWDPLKRPTPAEALQHPFFVGSYQIQRAIPLRPARDISGIGQDWAANSFHSAAVIV